MDIRRKLDEMSPGMNMHPRMMNPPIMVRWAGWESDTCRLGDMGWQLSMHEDISRNTLQLAMKHPTLNIYGVGKLYCENFNYMELRSSRPDRFMEILKHAGIDIQYMTHGSPKFQYQLLDLRNYQFDNFQPVDTEPMYVSTEIKTLEDFRMFTPVQGKEIVVMKRKVPELIKEALKAQEPKQAELREQQRKEIRKLMRDAREEDLKDIKQEECVARLIAL